MMHCASSEGAQQARLLTFMIVNWSPDWHQMLLDGELAVGHIRHLSVQCASFTIILLDEQPVSKTCMHPSAHAASTLIQGG